MPSSSYRRILEMLDPRLIEEMKALGRPKDQAVIALLEPVLRHEGRR